MRPWLLLILWITVPFAVAGDQDPAASGFLIETIRFVGLRSDSESILRSSLLLEEGKVYAEEDLARGKYRLERLTFVHKVAFELGKGSKRGAYQLIITIEETRRWFWAYLLDYVFLEKDYQSNFPALSQPPSNDTPRGNALIFGWRWFPGSNGELSVFGPYRPGIQYTHYNLFNRHVVGSLTFQLPSGYGKNFSDFPESGSLAEVEADSSYGATLSLSLPYKRHHLFNLTYQLNGGKIDYINPVGQFIIDHPDTTFRNHRTELSWTYDSKDHPLFPTSGMQLKASALLDREFRDVDDQSGPVTKARVRIPYRQLVLNTGQATVTGQKYWSLPGEKTAALELGGSWSNHGIDTCDNDPGYRAPGDYTANRFHARGMLAWNIWERKFLWKESDFRLQLEAGHWFYGSSLENVTPPADSDRTTYRLSLAIRDNHGLINISVSYSNQNEELWQ
ncbi:MAG: BamA/TamA family outer membrane protein [Acidobacteriota bacterium]|nr:BamA/TamA family outer membrane protein [Acidobacteriota bacterium]